MSSSLSERPRSAFSAFVQQARENKAQGLPVPKVPLPANGNGLANSGKPEYREEINAAAAPPQQRGAQVVPPLKVELSTINAGGGASSNRPKSTPRREPFQPDLQGAVGAIRVSTPKASARPPAVPLREHSQQQQQPLHSVKVDAPAPAVEVWSNPSTSPAPPVPHATRPSGGQHTAATGKELPPRPPSRGMAEPAPTFEFNVGGGGSQDALPPRPSSGGVPKFAKPMPLPQPPRPPQKDPRLGPELPPPPPTPFTDFTKRPRSSQERRRMEMRNGTRGSSRGRTGSTARTYTGRSDYSTAFSEYSDPGTPPPVWTDFYWGNVEPASSKDMFDKAMGNYNAQRDVLDVEYERYVQERMRSDLVEEARPQSSDVLGERYNTAVLSLKDRLMQRGPSALAAHFRALDLDQSGYLDEQEFLDAVKVLDDRIDDEVGNMLMVAVDADASGSVNYQEFVDALRFGRIPFHQRKERIGQRWRVGPDPDLPFGEPHFHVPADKYELHSREAEHVDVKDGLNVNASKMMENNIPFGIMSDSEENLRAFDKKANAMYQNIANIFESFDVDGSGTVDWDEFREAIKAVAPVGGISEAEIKSMFQDADKDGDGEIAYNEFIEAFGLGKRFIPEFLKPRSNRRSQAGHPWRWGVKPRYHKEYAEHIANRPMVGYREDVLAEEDDLDNAQNMRSEDESRKFGVHDMRVDKPIELQHEVMTNHKQKGVIG